MLEWLKKRWAIVHATVAAGDVRAVERRYFPFAVGVGVVLGALLGLLAEPLAALIVLIGGFALGYAARAYVSYRRRLEYLRRKGL